MKKLMNVLLALIMALGITPVCVSADSEPYPFDDLIYWEPYEYYKSNHMFELNWFIGYDENEIDFWPPCCIQYRNSSDGKWWTIEVTKGKPAFNSATVPWFGVDGKNYGEYRIYCPVFGYYDSYGEYHEEAITSDVIRIRQPFYYSPEIQKTSRSKTAVKLTWWAGSTCGDGTRIQQYDAKKKKWVNILTVRSSANSARVTGLKSGKTYKFRIRQYKRVADKRYPVYKKSDKNGKRYYSNVFWSEPSNVVTVKTKK